MVRDPAPSEARPRSSVPLPSRKPFHRARRISLFEREIRVTLSPAAIDILFHDAVELSEGAVADGWYGGTTMLTLDLGRASPLVSEACDMVTARQLEALLCTDARVHQRARSLAIRAAESRADVRLEKPAVDVRVARSGRLLLIDVDIEARVPELR